jgi:hypothetical protein
VRFTYSVLISAALASLSVSPASAQQSLTAMTRAFPVSSGGKNIACGLEFAAGVADTVYRAGALSAVSGSLYFYGYKDEQISPFLALKIVVQDKPANGEGFLANAPAQISLFGKDGKSLASKFYGVGNGETPGSKLASLAFDGSFDSVIASISEDDRLHVAFNRREGGMDVRIPIDLSVGEDGKRNHEGETSTRFLNCLMDLTQELQEKLK